MKRTPETIKKYVREARGWVYDEAVGDPENPIADGRACANKSMNF